MKTRSVLSLVAIVISSALVGCSVTEGNGVPGRDTRNVAPFQSLEIRNVDANIVVDPAAKGDTVEVTGDDNLVRLVEMRVDDGRLVVELGEHDVDTKLPLAVTFRTPAMRSIVAEREATVHIALEQPSALVLELSSGAQIFAEGKVARLEAELTGSATLDARTLTAIDADIEAAGSSTAYVCATGTLDIELEGGSFGTVYCAPRHIDRDIGSNSHLATAR